MFLKIMSDEDLPDSDTRKTFQIFDNVESADFDRIDEGNPKVHAVFTNGDDETFILGGNAYLMNGSGDTVAKFGCANPR